jgi:hypothetical protein
MSDRKIKVGFARLSENNRDIVVILENGKAFTLNGFDVINLIHKYVPSIDVLDKRWRQRREVL